MRTVSARHEKGKEPPRSLADDLRLLATIFSMGWGRVLRGRQIRREFRRCRQEKRKLYLEDIHLP